MRTIATWVFAAALLGSVAHADDAPPCLADNGSVLGLMDNQVMRWERSTPNQFLARAHVAGSIVEVYPDQNGHHHFAIQIGPAPSNRLEVVYNEDFGSVPPVQTGSTVEACGDYITSTAQSEQYPASPDGAIIHWVHLSPNPNKHPSGYLMIDGTLYGQDPQPSSGPQS